MFLSNTLSTSLLSRFVIGKNKWETKYKKLKAFQRHCTIKVKIIETANKVTRKETRNSQTPWISDEIGDLEENRCIEGLKNIGLNTERTQELNK